MPEKSIEDIMEEYDREFNIPIDVTDTVTHEEFVTGARNKTHGFKTYGESYHLLKGGRRTMFNIFVLLYTVVPIIIIPIFAFTENNWWLLLGVLFSYGASFSATWMPLINPRAKRGGSSIVSLALLYSIGHWIGSGFHFFDLSTFYFFCLLWGYMFFEIADSSQDDYALQALIESPDFFYDSISAGKIMIIKKRDN